MTSSTNTRVLHVANGSCTTRLIEAAGIPGSRSIWADPLHEGPVPVGLDDAQLVEVRARYLDGLTEPTTYVRPPASDAGADDVNDLKQWRLTIGRDDSYDELILWFEHDLFDQLNLIQLLTWIRGRVKTSKRVSLVCIGSFPGRQRFKGLGELTPREVASLLQARQLVSEAQYVLAERAWRAYREPTPKALDEVRRSDSSALPYLAAAIARLFQEYPWAHDGLSRSERRLLELAANGIALHDAFPRMQDGETAFYITDTSIAALAENLSGTSPALLTLTADEATNGASLRGSVALTDAGRAVLAGEQDRVALCGIDRWLGGVHLQGNANVWRWDDEGQRIDRR